MISRDLLDRIADGLSAFRGDGRGAILFDTRDRGNYAVHEWTATVAIMMEADPTWLSLGILLDQHARQTPSFRAGTDLCTPFGRSALF